MSIFTKILVVLVMVLAVLLSALVVPFVVNTDTFKQRWLDAEGRAKVAEVNAAQREADLATTLQSLNEKISQLQNENKALLAQISVKDTRIQEQQARVIELQSSEADVRSELARLGTGLKQASQINEMLQTEIKARRDQQLRLEIRSIELADSLRDKSTESDTLLAQVRLAKEQISALHKQNEELESRSGNMLQSEDPGLQELMPTVVARTPILGRVTGVKQQDDHLYVAINVGAEDQVKAGMLFMIHSGDAYVGDVLITKVDSNSAAGRVTIRRGTIERNMEVRTGAAF